jgi:hypothetical protein
MAVSVDHLDTVEHMIPLSRIATAKLKHRYSLSAALRLNIARDGSAS